MRPAFIFWGGVMAAGSVVPSIASEALRIGGTLAIDGRIYDDRNTRDDGIEIDRAVLRLEGEWTSEWSYRVAPDLVGTDTQYGLEEAWLAYQPSLRLRASAGLVKAVLGIEHGIEPEDLAFTAYAFPAYLDGRTDVGIRLEGEFEEGLFSYDGSITAGIGFDLNGQDRDEPQAGLRVVSYPFRAREWVSGLFLHAGFAYTPSYESELDVTNPTRNKLFDTPKLEADRSQWTNFGWGIDAGRVRIFHEFTKGSLYDLEEPGGGTVDLLDRLTAWQATASWRSFGGNYDTRPFRARSEPAANPAGLGAWELAVRYANGDIDRRLFLLGFTDYETSSQEFRAFSGAINWFPLPHVRASFQVVRNIADQTPQAFGGQGRDTSYVFRIQTDF